MNNRQLRQIQSLEFVINHWWRFYVRKPLIGTQENLLTGSFPGFNSFSLRMFRSTDWKTYNCDVFCEETFTLKAFWKRVSRVSSLEQMQFYLFGNGKVFRKDKFVFCAFFFFFPVTWQDAFQSKTENKDKLVSGIFNSKKINILWILFENNHHVTSVALYPSAHIIFIIDCPAWQLKK